MGSELGHVSMYYTEDEPPMENIGKKRHFFGKPSLKGMAVVNQGTGAQLMNQPRPTGGSMDGGNQMQAQNVSKDEVTHC